MVARKNQVMHLLCRSVLFILLMGGLSACGGSNSTPPPPANNPPATEVTFSGVGEIGIFDPSVAYDPNSLRLWVPTLA